MMGGDHSHQDTGLLVYERCGFDRFRTRFQHHRACGCPSEQRIAANVSDDDLLSISLRDTASRFGSRDNREEIKKRDLEALLCDEMKCAVIADDLHISKIALRCNQRSFERFCDEGSHCPRYERRIENKQRTVTR